MKEQYKNQKEWADDLLKAHKTDSRITVISTATHSYNFGRREKLEGGVQGVRSRINSVIVYGGANSQGRSGNGFVLEARDSVGTLVSHDELTSISENSVAYDLWSKGILRFESGQLHATDMSKAAKEGMTSKDHNAPLNEKGLENATAQGLQDNSKPSTTVRM